MCHKQVGWCAVGCYLGLNVPSHMVGFIVRLVLTKGRSKTIVQQNYYRQATLFFEEVSILSASNFLMRYKGGGGRCFSDEIHVR